MRTMPPRQPIDFADHARKRAEQLAKGRKILEERGLSLQSQSAPSYKESTPRPRPTISTFEVREEVPRQNSSQSLDDRPLGPNSNNMVRGKPAARRDGNVIPVDDVVAAPKRLGSGRRSSFMDEPQQQQQQINTTSSKPNPRSTSPMNSSRSRGSSFSDDIPAQSQHTNGNNFGIIVKEPTKSNIRTSSPRPSSQRNYQPQPPQPPPSYPEEEEEVDVEKELEEQRRQQAERNARLLKEQNQSGDAAMCECPECGRSFRADRIDKHLNVCRKVFGEKRKPFDMTQQRLDSEAMALAKNAEYEKKDTPAPKAKAIPKWKQQSLELQNAMKAARRADDSTAPIPEPIETRVECPYCGRRFADIAAERHIPICKNLSQKTKKPGKH